ncbi:MAG TPA: SCO family protein [Steroidobacteraceae bacterium]
MTTRSKFLYFAFFCAVGIAGAAAALVWRHPAPIELTTGTYITPSRTLPDFSLIDQRGQKFGPANLKGHWSLMFFGYTNCPDFCPTTLTTLAAMRNGLRASGSAVLPQVIFMSVDAKRDTPAQLAKYIPNFDPSFIGVTAPDQATIQAVAQKLGVFVSILPISKDTYAVNHSTEIFVVDPEGKLNAILTGPFTTDALQADFRRIVAGHA